MSAISRRRPGVSSHVILQSFRSSRFSPVRNLVIPGRSVSRRWNRVLVLFFFCSPNKKGGVGGLGNRRSVRVFPRLVDAFCASTRRGTVHAHYVLGSKKKTKDTDVTRVRLT